MQTIPAQEWIKYYTTIMQQNKLIYWYIRVGIYYVSTEDVQNTIEAVIEDDIRR